MLAWVTIRSAAGRPCAAADAPKRRRYTRIFMLVPYTILPPGGVCFQHPIIPAAHVHRSFRTRPRRKAPGPCRLTRRLVSRLPMGGSALADARDRGRRILRDPARHHRGDAARLSVLPLVPQPAGAARLGR